jgi:geranylgeranyl reductase family protein
MYKVGIIGAGVGGSYLSYLLSKEGVNNIIFDFRAPHEKLCGGGVSHKTMVRFPLLNELDCPRKMIWKSTFISPKDRMVKVDFEKPLTIFNRKDLDYSLLKKARGYGAHFRKEKVRAFTLEVDHWRISTETGNYKAKILVGADGALSRMRRKLNVPSMKVDYCFALECFLDVQKDIVTYKFFPDFEGYLWEFPRVDGLVVGIGSKYSKRSNCKDIKKKLLDFVERYCPEKPKTISVKGAYIPFFSANNLDVPVCSRNWALIGDAASFVEPISGEGIYYAIHSAKILAGCILENKLSFYQQLCVKHFGKNLVKASQTFEYFYQTELIETMIALAEKSKPIRKMLSEMVAGNLNYLIWKSRFRKEFFNILNDFIFNTDFKIKKELITNLAKLCSKYYRLFFGRKIS